MSSTLISVEVDEMNGNQDPSGNDAAIQAAVLQQLLFLHPVQVSYEELLREIAGDPGDFEQHDAIDRAVHSLVAAGLARRLGELVMPTFAALRFDALDS